MPTQVASAPVEFAETVGYDGLGVNEHHAACRGCEAGEPTSCFQLGELYKSGKGVKKKDAGKAAALRKKACDAGLKDACAG